MVPSGRVIHGLQKLQMATEMIKNCRPWRIHLHHCLCVSLSSLRPLCYFHLPSHTSFSIFQPSFLLSSSCLFQYSNLTLLAGDLHTHTHWHCLTDSQEGSKGHEPKVCVLRAIINKTIQSAFLDRRKTQAEIETLSKATNSSHQWPVMSPWLFMTSLLFQLCRKEKHHPPYSLIYRYCK